MVDRKEIKVMAVVERTQLSKLAAVDYLEREDWSVEDAVRCWRTDWYIAKHEHSYCVEAEEY